MLFQQQYVMHLKWVHECIWHPISYKYIHIPSRCITCKIKSIQHASQCIKVGSHCPQCYSRWQQSCQCECSQDAPYSGSFRVITQLCNLRIASKFHRLFSRKFAIHWYQNTDILYRKPMSFNMFNPHLMVHRE